MQRKDSICDPCESDVAFILKTGFLPNRDVDGGAMGEVIDDGMSYLNDADQAAIAAYPRDLPPLPGP